MAKVGSLVTDPKAGAYCQIKLDDGKILVNHDKASLTSGTLTVIEVKWLGLGAGDTLFECTLDSPEGRAMLSRLTQSAPAGSAEATPIGALIERFKECRTMAEVRARCAAI